MDWGIDPARVAEIAQIASSRRFSARDTEKFILAITGGGSENADMPLWDMLQILFALGALTARPGMGPRDAAIACMLDESGLLLRPLRADRCIEVQLAGAAVAASQGEVALTLASGKSRSFSWTRVRRGLGLADFLFAADMPDGRQESGLAALRGALDQIFALATFDDDGLKRAVAEPARFMRSWRRRHLPLLAFADMIRQREAYLLGQGRRDDRRALDPDDLVGFWSFALETGETWSFARFVERFSALLREERAGVGRRGLMAPVDIDGLVGGHPAENPEDAMIAWLDHQGELDTGDGDGLDEDEAGESDDEDDDGQQEPLRERAALALMRLPAEPKFLNKDERETVARVLALLPLAHEQPLTLVRARSVAPWENRLVEATRRDPEAGRGQVDRSAEPFDYAQVAAEIGVLGRRFDDLLLIGLALGATGDQAPGAVVAEGHKALKRCRHDRASFRIDDAKLALIFARHAGGLRTIASALRRIIRQQSRLGETIDLPAQAALDSARFGAVFAGRYRGRMKRL